jgi:hypothetical protein
MSASEDDVYDVDEAVFDDRIPILFTEKHDGRDVKVWRMGFDDNTPYYAINMDRSKFISHLVMAYYPLKSFYNNRRM